MPRYTAASKIGNSVISLLWQLRCRYNPDQNKFSSLSNTTVVVNFPKLCFWRRSLCWNLGGIDPEKLYRATLMSGTKLSLSPEPEVFFFSSQTFSLVLMQKTCLYFCYAVTMRSFSNRGSRDQSSSGFHTQFLLIIIYLLILSPCHSTGLGRTYQLFLL